jgi:DNA polymerase-3 subunit gamma/tau
MNTIKALYRTHRPTTFDEVIGQDHIVQVLTGMLNKKELGHAYLFVGSRGIGKTTLARIFAKELGCVPEDIYEIDGASHRKIEDIRELREGVKTLPFNSPYKVYIIDEVHMLTREAFNAFLKTLEEPPQHVIFMLATTEPEKIPDTITSRCQVFQLKKPSMQHIIDNLRRVADTEGYRIDDGGLSLIALLANGSFRDSLGVLQKVVSMSDDAELSEQEIENTLGLPPFQMIADILTEFSQDNTEGVFDVLSRLSQESHDPSLFLERLLHTVRTLFMARYTPAQRGTIQSSVSEHEWSLIESLLGEEGKSVNARVLARLLQVQREMKMTSQPAIPLELTFLELMSDAS